jgi:spermidine synthase
MGGEDRLRQSQVQRLGQGLGEVGVHQLRVLAEPREHHQSADDERAHRDGQRQQSEEGSRSHACFQGCHDAIDRASFWTWITAWTVRAPMRQARLVQRFDRSWRRRGFMGALGAAALAGVSRTARGLAPGERVLETAESEYNTIVVAERGTVRTMYFVVDGTYYIESRWDRAYAKSLDLGYTRTMMAGYLVNPDVKRLLMIGFGGGQISNYLFEQFEGLEVDAVDIDPMVIRLARKYFGVPDDPRYRTHAADGRLFVEQAGPEVRWDQIMLDAFRGVFVPFHLKTVEYYQSLAKHLTPKGTVVANLHSQTEMYKHDRNTFAAVFPQNYAYLSENGRQTTFVASADPEPVGAYRQRANARRVADAFDFDLLGLAGRWYLRTDWDTSAAVLRDDFPRGRTPQGAERHNDRCVGKDCKFSVVPGSG